MTMLPSPYDRDVQNEWYVDTPHFGSRGYDCTYKIFPARGDEEIRADWEPIPNDEEELQEAPLSFDFIEAESNGQFVRMTNTYHRPTIRWYSREEFKREFFYDPLNPPRPQGVDQREWEKYHKRRIKGYIDPPPMKLSPDRVTALQRIANLWNGEVVCGNHLLWNKCPPIKELTRDLDGEELTRLYYPPGFAPEIIAAFGEAEWFDVTPEFLKSTSIFRKQAWYDLTNKARTLLNSRTEFADLRGDLNEGLAHRVTVGLLALEDRLEERKNSSYKEVSGYVVDSVSKDAQGQFQVREVLTQHNNRELYRETYRKLRSLDGKNVEPIAVFDSRETAYKILNFWHRCGLGTLPNGTFNSDYSIPAGRRQVQQAYQSEDSDWAVADWRTTWDLWRTTLGSEGPEIGRETVTSINW